MRVSPSILSNNEHKAAGDEGSRESSSSHNGAESFGELDGPLMASGELDCSYCRKPYKQPRLLMCLHAFCESCIMSMLERSQQYNQLDSQTGNPSRGSGSRCSVTGLTMNDSDGGHQSAAPAVGTTANTLLDFELETPLVAEETQPPPGVVRCPICKQDSQVGNDVRFVQLLQLDYVTINLQDVNALEQMQLLCESCKSKEKAVARCVDCASVLCPNCVQAHQFMRCFENHKVVTFEEIKNSEESLVIHKPIFCNTHSNEQVRLFCATCRVPVCNECLLTTHKFMDHNYVKASTDVDTAAKERLKSLITKGQGKILRCNTESQEIETKLNELQSSVDEARVTVEYAFEKYQAMLENRRQKLLGDLGSLQTELETKILRTSQQISNTSEKIRDAISFTERLLKHGNTMELLCSMSIVEAQLLQVIHSVPSARFAVKVNFINDEKIFDESLLKSAGYFYADLESKPPESNLAVDSLLTPVAHYPPSVISPALLAPGAFGATNQAHAALSGLLSQPPSIGLHATHSMPNFDHGAATTTVTTTSTPFDVGTAFTSLVPGARSSLVTPVLRAGDGAITPPMRSMLSNGGIPAPPNEYAHYGGGLDNVPPCLAPSQFCSWMDSSTTGVERALGALALSAAGQQPMPGLSVDGWGVSGAMSAGGGLTPPSDSGSSGGGHGIGGSAAAVFQQGLPPNMYSQNLLGPSSMSGLTPPIRQAKMNSIKIRCNIGSLGSGNGQFNSPHGFCLSPATEDIVVADTNNHRIQIFDKSGQHKGQFGVAGKDDGQLWYPRKVAILRHSNKFIVCDRGHERSRMQIFTRSGAFVKKIAIRYIDIVAGICVDRENRVVAVDSVSPTVFCIDENGDLVHWFDCAKYMKEPSDIAVYGNEYYICDFKGHCVCVFSLHGEFLRKIGCEGITNFPNGIDISDAGDILIGDSHGNRFHVAVFKRSGELQVEYECPWIKVSRCCGLRITSEGLIITIAKNNHHVLILDTLYVD